MDKGSMRFPFILALSVFAPMPHAQAAVCTGTQATQADAEIDRMNSWEKVARVFKRYGRCDSGSIAEGNSEAVARLLTDHWATLPTLVKLARANPAFRDFVVRHVDTTLDTQDLDRIRSLTASACPKEAVALCRDLHSAATRALSAPD
jgi:hypothetical protein